MRDEVQRLVKKTMLEGTTDLAVVLAGGKELMVAKQKAALQGMKPKQEQEVRIVKRGAHTVVTLATEGGDVAALFESGRFQGFSK